MSKTKKTVLFVLVVCLGAGGLWAYWEWEMPLSTLLSDKNWQYASLVGLEFDPDDYALEHVAYAMDKDSQQEIIEMLSEMKVSRSFKRPNAGRFWVVLSAEDRSMVSLLVGRDGIIVAGGKRERWYEGGEEICQYLEQFAQSLHAAN